VADATGGAALVDVDGDGDGDVDESTGAAVLAGAAAGAPPHAATMTSTLAMRIPHLPWNFGLRFSANAASASRRSSLTIVRS
jgi:hypothetical protein